MILIEGVGLTVGLVGGPGPGLVQEMKGGMRRDGPGCGDEDFLVCRAGGNKKLCGSGEVVCSVCCEDCVRADRLGVYGGGTGRSSFAGGAEHVKPMQSGGEGALMKSWVKHSVAEHGGGGPQCKMGIIGGFQHDPLARQICEGVLRGSGLRDESLNDGGEWGRPEDVIASYDRDETLYVKIFKKDADAKKDDEKRKLKH